MNHQIITDSEKIKTIKNKMVKIAERIAKDKQLEKLYAAELREAEREEYEKRILKAGSLIEKAGMLGKNEDELIRILQKVNEQMKVIGNEDNEKTVAEEHKGDGSENNTIENIKPAFDEN